jgi:hypothetical protein
MRQKIALVLAWIFVGLLAGASAVAQNAAPPSLKEQLEAQYKLAKREYKSGQVTVTEPGTVLVIQQGGIQGVPLGDLAMSPAIYKDGALHPPSKKSGFATSLIQASTRPNSETSGKDFRSLPVGDKVYIAKINIDVKKDRIVLIVMECAECNGDGAPPPYKASVSFQFAKGYLETASVPDVEDTIGKVFAIDTATAAAQPAQPEPPPEQRVAQTEEPPAPTGAPALTNDDIIKLVQAKLADSLIITKIKSSDCAFDTSTDRLVRLKQAGVSDAVLQVMVEGNQPAAAPTAEQPSQQTTAVPEQNETSYRAGPPVRWHGTIVRRNEDQSTLVVRKGNVDKFILYDASTQWTQGTTSVGIDEFTEGSEVICLGNADDRGSFHATRCDLRAKAQTP